MFVKNQAKFEWLTLFKKRIGAISLYDILIFTTDFNLGLCYGARSKDIKSSLVEYILTGVKDGILTCILQDEK